MDTNRRNVRRWTFQRNGTERVVTVDGRFRVNSAQAACESAASGHGIAFSPRFAICDELASGRLVTLLDDYTQARNPVSAIYLDGHRLPLKVRALIDFSVQDIQLADIL